MKIRIAFFILLIPFCSTAQQELSLEEAIAIALKNNYQITIAKKQAEIAENNNAWGQTTALPRVDLNSSYNFGITDNSENPTSFIQEELQSSSLSYGATANWTLFDGLNMFLSKDRLELLQSLSEGNADVVVENTVQAVILGYYNALLQKDKLDVLSEVIDLSRDRFKYEETRLELGTGSTFDRLQFQNAILTDSTNYLIQELAYRNAIRNLNLLMARSIDDQFTLTTSMEEPNQMYQYDALRSEMLANNSALENQFFNSVIAQKDVKIAQSAMYPTLGFNASYSDQASSFEAGELSGDGRTLSYFGTFTLNFNLFNGGKTRRAIQNAKINEEIALLTQQELELSVTQELLNTYELFVAQQKIYTLSQESKANAQVNLTIASERFVTGTINSFNYRDAQLAYLQSATSLIEAQYNTLVSKVALVRLTGGLVKE